MNLFFWRKKKVADADRGVVYWSGPHGILNQYNLVETSTGKILGHVYRRCGGQWAVGSDGCSVGEYVSREAIQAAMEKALVTPKMREAAGARVRQSFAGSKFMAAKPKIVSSPKVPRQFGIKKRA